MALTLSEAIGKELADDIVAGRIPAGSRLDEVSLAERFSVSRSPVRDALRDLARTRLVEYQPRRGFSVASIDPEAIKDLYEGLTEIEAICAGLCAMRSSYMERVRIQRLHDQCIKVASAGNYEQYAKANDEFHQAIYAGSHNSTLEAVANELRQRLAPLRTGMFFQQSRIDDAIQEHRELVDALLKQDAAAATKAMRNHAVLTSINVLDGISSNLKSPARSAVPGAAAALIE